MQVAIIVRPNDSASLRHYASNITREICSMGVEVFPIQEDELIPTECDLVWDPAMCMRRIPYILKNCQIPIIGTMHGIKAFSMPIEELTTNAKERRNLLQLKKELIDDWNWFRSRVDAIIAVSDFCKKELIDAFKINPDKVHTIHHGNDRIIFSQKGNTVDIGRPYFLNILRIDPIKNVNRILNAYSILPKNERPDLVIIAIPELDQASFSKMLHRNSSIPGVHLLYGEVSQEELAMWYRGALALIFPSLRETFGLPIVEAMACGCPVITSYNSGCAEIAGNAAILVDPRSVNGIAHAMLRVIEEPFLRQKLKIAGFRRSQLFSWQKSAKNLVQVFRTIIAPERKRTPRMRKIEVTTITSCHIACEFCPQQIFQNNYSALKSKNKMDWKTYTSCINNLPKNVSVIFGGMSEPFMNSLCTDMVFYAKEKGHKVEIFTTLMGLNVMNLERLLNSIDFSYNPSDNRLFIHLPSVEQYEKVTINEEYLYMLDRLLSSKHHIEFHYHGSRILSELNNIQFDNRLKHWPLHNRAVNETAFYGKCKRKDGKIGCIMNLEVNFLLPDGDVLICCQDHGIQHIIGNLIHSDYSTLYQSTEFKRIQASLLDDKQEIMCRYCDFAIQEISSQNEDFI